MVERPVNLTRVLGSEGGTRNVRNTNGVHRLLTHMPGKCSSKGLGAIHFLVNWTKSFRRAKIDAGRCSPAPTKDRN